MTIVDLLIEPALLSNYDPCGSGPKGMVLKSNLAVSYSISELDKLGNSGSPEHCEDQSYSGTSRRNHRMGKYRCQCLEADVNSRSIGAPLDGTKDWLVIQTST